MARKPKERKHPIVNKEYIWNLEVEDEMHEFKVFVGEDECITYADGVECKRLKIMDKRQMYGLLQIDCETRVLDEVVPFQLENGIPYIKIEDDEGNRTWNMSETTLEDRLQDKIRRYKVEAFYSATAGVVALIGYFIYVLITGSFGEWPIAPIFGIFFISASAMNMVRLKNELEAMGRKLDWKLRKEDFQSAL